MDRALEMVQRGTFCWEDLPFEIRDQIFSEVNKCLGYPYFHWDTSMPQLVVALRTLPKSYEHVLQWFAKQNSRVFLCPRYPSPSYTILDMSKVELSVIKTMAIDLSKLVGNASYRPDEKPTFFTKHFLDMTNLHSIELFFDLRNEVHVSDQEDFITQFPFWLQGCKRLSEVRVEIPTYGLNNPWRRNLIEGIVKRIFRKTSVLGQLVEMVRYGFNYESGEAELWSWKSAPGRYMDWTQELGWKCKHRCSVVELPPWNFYEESCGLEFRDGMFIVEWWEKMTSNFEIVWG
ncbi:hypothetical protein EG329_000208 [Mollisiaceae sp. DMI_Dod_QoI]|nr:hypothetical protein EG329_000208 [Helotiales sp. DMI_Dod_QoI]